MHFVISIPTPNFPHFNYMLGGHLEVTFVRKCFRGECVKGDQLKMWLHSKVLLHYYFGGKRYKRKHCKIWQSFCQPFLSSPSKMAYLSACRLVQCHSRIPYPGNISDCSLSVQSLAYIRRWLRPQTQSHQVSK